MERARRALVAASPHPFLNSRRGLAAKDRWDGRSRKGCRNGNLFWGNLDGQRHLRCFTGRQCKGPFL
jgi:hypothetical protein